MTLENFKAFLAKVKDDTSLQEKLKDAKSPEEVVTIAKEHGHDFTADKLSQLSNEELENVSGGWCFVSHQNNSNVCASMDCGNG